jgi:hypothetical protein
MLSRSERNCRFCRENSPGNVHPSVAIEIEILQTDR